MDEVYNLLSPDEMKVLKAHYKATKDGNGKLDDKLWTQDRKRVVATLYQKIRDNGYRLVGQYPSGSPKFAAIRKSAVEQIMDLSDDDFRLYRDGSIKFVGGRLQRVGESACQ